MEQRSARDSFSWKIALASALGVVFFLLVFRPFGLQVSTLDQMWAIVGLAPLIFSFAAALHYLVLPRMPASPFLKRVVSITGLSSIILVYLKVLSAKSIGALVLPVLLIMLLVVSATWLWRERSRLQTQMIYLKGSSPAVRHQIIFRSEDGRQVLKLDPSSIRFAKAEGNYVSIHWQLGDTVAEELFRATLSDIEAMGGGFLVPCHRSYLVNLEYADRLEGSDRAMKVRFSDGTAVPVSRNKAKYVRRLASGEQ